MTITCTACIEALKTPWSRPGNPARPEMGHVMYSTPEGRISACLAKVVQDAFDRQQEGQI